MRSRVESIYIAFNDMQIRKRLIQWVFLEYMQIPSGGVIQD